MRFVSCVVLAFVALTGCGRGGFVFPNHGGSDGGDSPGDGGDGNDQTPGGDNPGDVDLPPTKLGLTFVPGSAWNQYVSTSGLACVSDDYRDCTHAGEIRRFKVDLVPSCDGLVLSDSADAFDWRCVDEAGLISFVSTGLKAGRGLRDLIDFDAVAFRSMTVSLQGASEPLTSAPAVWWTNPVKALPSETLPGITVPNEAETVYVALNDYSGNIQDLASGVSIVMPRGKLLAPTDGSTVQCSAFLAAGSAPINARCAITAQNAERIWIEADFAAPPNSSTYGGISAQSVKLMRVHAATFAAGYTNPVFLYQSNANRITNVTASKSDSFVLYTSSGNVLRDVRLAGSAMVLAQSNNNVIADATAFGSATGVSVTQGSSSNHFVGLVSFAVTQSAWLADNTSPSNTLVASSLALCGQACLDVGTSADTTIIHASFALASATSSLVLRGQNATVSDMIAGEATQDGVLLAAGAGPNRFAGSLHVTGSPTSCSIATTTPSPGLTGTCAAQGNSDPALASSTESTISPSFTGAVTSDSQNTSDANGTATFAAAGFDYANADSRFRGWSVGGAFFSTNARNCPASGGAGGCFVQAGSAVRLIDLTPTLNDSRVRNGITTASFVDNAACPINGNFATSDLNGGNRYLRAAIELVDDHLGDDDGLCESNEACVYAPSYGAYQGNGDYRLHRCDFIDGTVTGVALYGYPPTAF